MRFPVLLLPLTHHSAPPLRRQLAANSAGLVPRKAAQTLLCNIGAGAEARAMCNLNSAQLCAHCAQPCAAKFRKTPAARERIRRSNATTAAIDSSANVTSTNCYSPRLLRPLYVAPVRRRCCESPATNVPLLFVELPQKANAKNVDHQFVVVITKVTRFFHVLLTESLSVIQCRAFISHRHSLATPPNHHASLEIHPHHHLHYSISLPILFILLGATTASGSC